MKRNKKLLALLLCAVMVGQMGVVAGWAATCGTNGDHGKTAHVAAACGENCTHWLEGSTMTGSTGTGVNYYFTSVGDTINCVAGTNIIVIESLTKKDGVALDIITISGFGKAGDKIYLPSGSTWNADGTGSYFIDSTPVYITQSDGNLYTQTVSTATLPTGSFTIDWKKDNRPGYLEVKLNNAAGDEKNCTYEWKINDKVLSDTGASIPITTDTGKWTYTCTAFEDRKSVV